MCHGGSLFAHITGADLGRVPDPHLVSHLLQAIDEPLTVTAGFHADQRAHGQLPVEVLGFSVPVHQFALAALSGLRIEKPQSAASWDGNHTLQ